MPAFSPLPPRTMFRGVMALSVALVVWSLHTSPIVYSQYDGDIYLPTSNGMVSGENATSGRGMLDLEPGQSVTFTNRNRRRIFLGIFTRADMDSRLRNAIRKTYLREHQQPINVCSVAEMQENCDVVYAFINHIGVKGGRQLKQEIDVLYLYEAKVNRILSMYQYLAHSNMLRSNNASALKLPVARSDVDSPTVQFDFVAHTSTSYVLCPDRVWPQDLLHGNNPVYTHPLICMIPAGGASDQGETSIEGYSLISAPLVERLLKDADFPLPTQGGHMGEELYKALLKIGSMNEILIANQSLHSYDPYEIVMMPLQDPVLRVPKGTFGDLLIASWDSYKDNYLVTYQDATEEARVRSNPRTNLTKCRHGPRVILGIMTMIGSDIEAQRRQAVRETYLSYFNQSTTEGYRICALHDLIDKTREDHIQLLEGCQLAYVFVVGGNPNGLKERVDYSDSEPMTLPSYNITEADIVLLNIQENMKEGKSQTYLKYATTIIDDHLYFDYVAKTDSDTLIFTERFLNHELRHLPSFPDNVRVYGGCNLVSRNEYGDINGPIYFAGSLYFMSVDLARYVTSTACDRKRMAVNSEDQSMGNFVHSHPQPLHRIKMAYPAAFKDRRRGKDEVWDHSTSRHPLKDLGAYRAAWERYLGLVAKGLGSHHDGPETNAHIVVVHT